MMKLAADSYQVQKMSADGSTVESASVINNAESVAFSDQQIRTLHFYSNAGTDIYGIGGIPPDGGQAQHCASKRVVICARQRWQ
jgi:hypothetical protein